MKNHTFYTSTITLFITILLSITTHACYRTQRQLSQSASRIPKHHGNQTQNQRALVENFKQSIASNMRFKPAALHAIAHAVTHKNSLKQVQKSVKNIHRGIDIFHKAPGFLTLLSRILDGANSKNFAHFTGALGELKAALAQEKKQKVIYFGRKIFDENGRIRTEIDFETEDENGTITWQEVKTRTKERKFDLIRKEEIEAKQERQRVVQESLALEEGARYKQLKIVLL